MFLIGVFILALTLDPDISSDGEFRYEVVEALLSGDSLPKNKESTFSGG